MNCTNQRKGSLGTEKQYVKGICAMNSSESAELLKSARETEKSNSRCTSNIRSRPPESKRGNYENLIVDTSSKDSGVQCKNLQQVSHLSLRRHSAPTSAQAYFQIEMERNCSQHGSDQQSHARHNAPNKNVIIARRGCAPPGPQVQKERHPQVPTDSAPWLPPGRSGPAALSACIEQPRSPRRVRFSLPSPSTRRFAENIRTKEPFKSKVACAGHAAENFATARSRLAVVGNERAAASRCTGRTAGCRVSALARAVARGLRRLRCVSLEGVD